MAAWNELTDEYVRTGVLASWRIKPWGNTLLPIQRNMRRCTFSDAGVVQYYLDPDVSTKKADGTAADLDGIDGQVVVEIPKL